MVLRLFFAFVLVPKKVSIATLSELGTKKIDSQKKFSHFAVFKIVNLYLQNLRKKEKSEENPGCTRNKKLHIVRDTSLV